MRVVPGGKEAAVCFSPADRRPLGRTGLAVSPIGFGAFKIGRNQKTKYPAAYDLPSESAVERLLCGLADSWHQLHRHGPRLRSQRGTHRAVAAVAPPRICSRDKGRRIV